MRPWTFGDLPRITQITVAGTNLKAGVASRPVLFLITPVPGLFMTQAAHWAGGRPDHIGGTH